MISFGFEGFADVILSVVMRFCPAITSGYSRPNMDFTWRNPSSIALRFSGFEKSVNGSFTNSPRSIFVAAALAGDGVAGVDVDVMVGSPRCVNPNCNVRSERPQRGGLGGRGGGGGGRQRGQGCMETATEIPEMAVLLLLEFC